MRGLFCAINAQAVVQFYCYVTRIKNCNFDFFGLYENVFSQKSQAAFKIL